MARIPVHTVASAPEESKEIAGKLEKRMGKLLNIHAEMAHSPVVIAAYHGISQAIAAHGTFDARTKEAIALAVGNQNGCDYCQAAARTGDVPDAVWQEALENGWTEAELAEAFAHIAANLFTNYFNHYARTDLDLPSAEPLTA